MSLPHNIGILTPELVCFHEAGHVITAVTIGARVVNVSILAGPPPYGFTKIDRTDPQAAFIACGGFAAEYHLWKTSRLVDSAGRPVDLGTLLSEAQQNAKKDVQNFVRGMRAMNARIDDPVADLTGIAVAKVYPQIDFALVEKLAAALLKHRVLEEAPLNDVIGGRRSELASRYSLQRMIGYGRIRAFVRTFKRMDS